MVVCITHRRPNFRSGIFLSHLRHHNSVLFSLLIQEHSFGSRNILYCQLADLFSFLFPKPEVLHDLFILIWTNCVGFGGRDPMLNQPEYLGTVHPWIVLLTNLCLQENVVYPTKIKITTTRMYCINLGKACKNSRKKSIRVTMETTNNVAR